MAGKTSIENGKKGGRPKGAATIEREKMKDYIAGRIAENGEAIVGALMVKAIEGDVPAIKELFDRGFGKPTQETQLTGKDGKDLFEPSARIKAIAHELIKNSDSTGVSTSC